MAAVNIVPGKAQYQSNCICVYNIDISSGGCPIALNKDGNFDRSLECQYCYASYVHRNYVKPKQVDEKVWKNFKKEALLNVIRIGKNLEPGHKIHRKILYNVLDLNNKYEFRTILITKLLEFDNEIVRLIKAHNSTIHFSMGNELLETGAILNGATNEWRLKTAEQYFDSGVNTYLRIVEDVALPMREEVKKWCEKKIPILITPLRFNSKRVLNLYNSELNWDELKNSNTHEYINGYLQAKIWHEDYKPYKERCGKLAGIEHCNNCGLGKIKNWSKIND